jgi:hypothetical protein
MREYRESPFRYLYLIGSRGHDVIKIGISDCPSSRIQDLSRQSDRTLIPGCVDRSTIQVLHQEPGGRRLELALHRHFRGRQVLGEWYDLGPVGVPLVKSVIREWRATGRIGALPTPASAPAPSEPEPTPRPDPATQHLVVVEATACGCVRMKDTCRVCEPGYLGVA